MLPPCLAFAAPLVDVARLSSDENEKAKAPVMVL